MCLQKTFKSKSVPPTEVFQKRNIPAMLKIRFPNKKINFSNNKSKNNFPK